jgi:hypothetical protein
MFSTTQAGSATAHRAVRMIPGMMKRIRPTKIPMLTRIETPTIGPA